LKFLHIIGTYKPAYIYGGPIFSISLLCENLAKAGHEVEVFTTTANGPVELDVPIGKKMDVDGVTVTYFRRLTKDHSHLSPGLFWQVWKRCREFDVVHVHAWWNLPAIVSVLICWLRGVKPVMSPRGMLSGFSFEKSNASVKAIFHRTAGRFLLKKTTLHLTAAAEQEETQGIGADSFVLPNFIQTAAAPHSSLLASHSLPFTLIFLSRIHPKKNLEGLFEALAMVSFDFRLQIAGKGEDAAYADQLKERAVSMGISQKIEWLGEVYEEEKFRRYAEASLFVLPSFNENFANVVIEALSAGTPVLVSEEVGLAEYVRENDLGWICGTNPRDIATALEEIFLNENKRAEIRRKAPAIAERDFSPKALTDKYLEQYRKISSGTFNPRKKQPAGAVH
jgi:glycosyltransferase involved in cell wall biosynthesis